MSAVEALRRCPLFQGMTDTGLLIFASIARERRLPAGAALFTEGEEGESLFVVVSGSLRLLRRTEGGGEEAALVGEGDHAGALSLLAPGRRLVSAVAATDCALLELGAKDFAALQPGKPKACLKLALAVAADVSRRAAEARAPLQRALARAGAGE